MPLPLPLVTYLEKVYPPKHISATNASNNITITAVFLLFFLSDLCCVISDALHKNFLFQTACSLFVLFLARLFARPHGYSAITNNFRNKKSCNLVSVRYYIATGRTLFIKRRLALSRSPSRRYVVYKKVPWLCVTASRRFCRQVFNCYEGKSTSGLCRSSPLCFYYTRRKTPCQAFFNFFCKLWIYCVV